MINLFFSDSAAEIAHSRRKEFGISDEEYAVLALRLHAGDITEPFNVSSRREVYNAYYKLDSDISSGIRRLKQLLKSDKNLCIWYSSKDVDEYLGMLATVSYFDNSGLAMYICDCADVCERVAVLDENTDVSGITRHLLTPDERSSFLSQWAKLQAENSPLRVMENGEIVGKPVDFADERIYNVIGDAEVRVGEICSQLMHSVLSFKFDFIIWRIRQLLAQDKLVLVKQGMCDQCYGKPFEDFVKSIVRINEKE